MPIRIRLLPIDRAPRRHVAVGAILIIAVACLLGCQSRGGLTNASTVAPPVQPAATSPQNATSTAAREGGDIRAVSYDVPAAAPPPKVRDFAALRPWPMSLDEAVLIALENSPVIRAAGGQAKVTTFDADIFAADPGSGPEAALAAFDTQFKSNLTYRGGGNLLASGAFGVYSQPRNKVEVGVARTFHSGTSVRVGGATGYDAKLAGGIFAAYGVDLRHPLLRGSGKELNMIAGPNARPGAYRGVWIAQLDADKVDLELEQAILDLVRDVASTYWALYFSSHDLAAKQAALERARQTWEREQARVAERASPPDVEAIARQQYFSAYAAVQNAISGTAAGGPGVYETETKLRELLALPAADGSLIRPTNRPLEAEMHFDWNEALQLAHHRRVELRRFRLNIEKRELELRAAHNLRRPRLDVVGQFWRPAGDPSSGGVLFSGALQSWQIGVEYSRALGNRRENGALRAAELRLAREHALLRERQRQLSAQLRSAFTEIDRAYNVTQSLAASRDAAIIRMQAEQQRHAAGNADIDTVLEAQIRAAQAETAVLRSLVDYNLAIIHLHYVRGTLLETLGVGLAKDAAEEGQVFAQNGPSIFTATQHR